MSVLTLILLTAMAAGSPEAGGQAGSWILTKKLDGSVGYVWGYKDKQGLVHLLGVGKPRPGESPINYGLSREKFEHIPVGGDWYGGNVKTRSAPVIVGATGVPPKRVHLTIIGPKEQREAARADLTNNPDFQALATQMGDGLAVQDYDPKDPMIADIKIADGGSPDIVIQSETGKVRFRAHDYPGAAVVVAELRKADPRYDPKKDPDGKPAVPDLGSLFDSLPPIDDRVGIFFALGIVVVASILRNKVIS